MNHHLLITFCWAEREQQWLRGGSGIFCALGMWETPRDATPAVFQGPEGDPGSAEALGGGFTGVGLGLGVQWCS